MRVCNFPARLSGDLSGAHVFIVPEVNDCLLAAPVASMFSG